MSKKKRRRPAPSIVLAAGFLAFLTVTPFVTAQQQRRAAVAPSSVSAARSEAVKAATNEVLAETGELRRLPPLRPVVSGVKSREEIKNLVVTRLGEETTPQEMHANEAALRSFGLVDASFKLRAFLIDLLTEQIAGYYDPRAKEFYLADWIDLDQQKLVMSHELTHALQDQHFNLARFEKWPKGDSDAELAAQALIEGDATLTMGFYMVRNPQRALGVLKSLLATAAGQSEQIENAPPALRATLLFPYDQGRTWAMEIYSRGGWEALSAAYKDLPQSTEQILHSEKYLAREAPVKINLPDVSAALGPQWKRIEYNVNGEWGYYLILGQFLTDDETAKRAASGWGGDRYALYEHPATGRLCVVHLSVWDTEQDAREFFDAYARRTQLKADGPSSTPNSLPPPATSANGEFSLAGKEGMIEMRRRESRVLIVEGLEEKRKATVVELLKKSL